MMKQHHKLKSKFQKTKQEELPNILSDIGSDSNIEFLLIFQSILPEITTQLKQVLLKMMTILITQNVEIELQQFSMLLITQQPSQPTDSLLITMETMDVTHTTSELLDQILTVLKDNGTTSTSVILIQNNKQLDISKTLMETINRHILMVLPTQQNSPSLNLLSDLPMDTMSMVFMPMSNSIITLELMLPPIFLLTRLGSLIMLVTTQ